MSGSAACKELALWQQLDPKPSTTSTAPRTRPLAWVTLLVQPSCAALVAPPDSPDDDGWLAAASPPVPPSSVVAAIAVVPPPVVKRTVPVNASRASPTTRAITITAASGATGTQLVRWWNARLIRHSAARQCHGWGGLSTERLTAAAVRPYHARASTTPASPATATTAGASRRVIRIEAADKKAKLASSHAAVRTGGRRRHQACPTPPWLRASAVPSMMGTAARYGQENGTRATPNISVTTGDITSHTSTVSTAHDTIDAKNRGLGRLGTSGSLARGQASRTSTASTAERTSSSSTSTPVKPSHDWSNANSQRRSW